ncbi:uncharacterized protein A4U43_C07F18080 [Asparagus officinalis]|uniref:Uncharacterized protein n=1 Tax=Asparagus officinalis TaxID=4686 RepID=A0A5P1EI19_ASPOF|nr:uncharacterized protein A4U43_C07F18080 [Asparagus officinalis]
MAYDRKRSRHAIAKSASKRILLVTNAAIGEHHPSPDPHATASVELGDGRMEAIRAVGCRKIGIGAAFGVAISKRVRERGDVVVVPPLAGGGVAHEVVEDVGEADGKGIPSCVLSLVAENADYRGVGPAGCRSCGQCKQQGRGGDELLSCC